MLPKHGRLRQLLALVLASRIFWDWRHGRQASVTTTICKDKDGGCDQVGVDDAKGMLMHVSFFWFEGRTSIRTLGSTKGCYAI